MNGVRVLGVSGLLPTTILDSSLVGAAVGVDAEWIVRRTGIRERRRADPGRTSADLAVEAARPLVAALPDIGAVVVASMTPDRQCPGMAPAIAERLGLSGVGAWDVNSACAGFVCALAGGAAMVAAGQLGRILVIGSDVMSSMVSPTDRNTAVVFGDGAGAVVLGETSGRVGRVGPFVLGSDGSRAELAATPFGGGHLSMRGQEVFEQAVDRMGEAARTAVAKAGWSLDEVDWLVGHQANGRILSLLGDVLGIGPARRVACVDRMGNTANASIPLALADLAGSGRLRAGDRIAVVSFGGGLAWGATTLEWPDGVVVCPPDDVRSTA
ncbi:beta-ketoacyl-ACP synthase 3 (plasmid) [Streptomyces sp. BI20]|uniref:beta-ketoacyl-ACP synthase 3 n=1 Tax=Streptomyces sp. BI20 TaxID=3403460 RepID=UPI003C78D069